MTKLTQPIGLALLSLGMFACSNSNGGNENYVELSGTVDPSITEITLQSQMNEKTIMVEDGKFSDTLVVAEPTFYQMKIEDTNTFVFLKNGYDLDIVIPEEISEISFTGNGEESNNYLAAKLKMIESPYMNPETYFVLEPEAFASYKAEAEKALGDLILNAGDIDSTLAASETSSNANFFAYIDQNYQMRRAFQPGKPSPTFENYENYEGGKTSLSDLRGKYVYIDVWATWCGPCKVQIPFMKKLEEEYKGKNIEFVGISIDQPNKYEAWRKMVKDEELAGIQLYQGTDQQFSIDYQISGIPRFILIDPQGNIVNAHAPRPSQSAEIKSLFSSLDL